MGYTATMLDWKQLPRSVRLETGRYALDVWKSNNNPYYPWSWTVFDQSTGHYVGNGVCESQDEACEAALKFAKA